MEPQAIMTEVVKDEPKNGICRQSVVVASPSVEVEWFKNGKAISKQESILKFEQMKKNNQKALCQRILIVKNLKNNEKPDFSVKCSNLVKSNYSSGSSSRTSGSKMTFRQAETETARAQVHDYDTGSNELFTKQKVYEQKSVWSKGDDGEWLRSYKVKEWKISELIDNQFKCETKDTKWLYDNSKCIWLPAEEFSQ